MTKCDLLCVSLSPVLFLLLLFLFVECWCVDFLVYVGAIGASLERARRVTGILIESVHSLCRSSSSCSSTYYGMLRDTIRYTIYDTVRCDKTRLPYSVYIPLLDNETSCLHLCTNIQKDQALSFLWHTSNMIEPHVNHPASDLCRALVT